MFGGAGDLACGCVVELSYAGECMVVVISGNCMLIVDLAVVAFECDDDRTSELS